MWRGGRVLMLVAHPDDETLAFGGEMEHWPDCVIAHTTTGAPEDAGYAHAAGFATAADYAAERQRELQCALGLVLGGDAHLVNFDLIDQQSWRDLAGLTRRVQALIADVQPAAILTHPYEGGHPDHDAAAFAVQISCTALGAKAPVRIEGAFYHRAEGAFQANQFLPGPPATEVVLDPAARARKAKMFACFASQQTVLANFAVDVERYRSAPQYDFTAPPHAGPLNYETLGWGITSAMFVESVRHTRAVLAE